MDPLPFQVVEKTYVFILDVLRLIVQGRPVVIRKLLLYLLFHVCRQK